MNNSNFEQIDTATAKELMEKEDVTIVDIRDSNSYQQAHIPSATWVNDGNVESFLTQADKTKPLICYCYHGHSSQSAAQYFSQQGFQKVFSIIGGFEEWRTVYPSETRKGSAA
jgi:thiosulfate sulfurtransferase